MQYADFSVKIVRFGENNYPKILARIKDPPKRLYYRGDLKALKQRSVAIVGSRKMSRYGAEMVDRLVSGLVAEKVATISGFMYGVDTEVHRRTVEYGGVTAAVLGCGVDVIYPPENEKLYGEILGNGGVVLSEYKPEAKAHLWKFPQRNRIVAGLAKMGVVVIEAGQRSGSLITARMAREQGKKVFAVPGPVTSAVSAGTNWLIKEGKAKMVTGVEDVLGVRKAGNREQPDKVLGLTGLEKKIWEALEVGELNCDEVAVQTGAGVAEAGATLTVMGIKGLVSESGGKWYLVGRS